MKITRLDLDGTGSPDGLVAKIFKAIPDLQIPVPVEELALALDITDIDVLSVDGFEGGLITDECKSEGTILVNKAARRGRRRFTIGHELGHFLIPTHMPGKENRFLCSREDMKCWSANDNNAYIRKEVEANKFAAALLMPPQKMRVFVGQWRDPDLSHVLKIASEFDVSKEPAARAYALYQQHPIAIAVIKDGKVLRFYRNIKFPKIGVADGSRVPIKSLFHRTANVGRELTEIAQIGAEFWIVSDWGKRLPLMYEQVLHQRDGYALIMLWTEFPDDDDEDSDPDEGRTSKERFRERTARKFR